jgi:hypothetical protein
MRSDIKMYISECKSNLTILNYYPPVAVMYSELWKKHETYKYGD